MFLDCEHTEHILWSLITVANIILALSLRSCPAKGGVCSLLFLEAKLNSLGRDNPKESL